LNSEKCSELPANFERISLLVVIYRYILTGGYLPRVSMLLNFNIFVCKPK